MAVEVPGAPAVPLPFLLAPVTGLVRPACPADEAEWARAAAAGDKAAFARLVEKHKQSVHGLCFRMLGAGEEARDAAQEAFVRAYIGIGDFDPRQPFAAWVLRIARNHCIDLLRRRRPMLALAAEGRGDDPAETGVAPQPDGTLRGPGGRLAREPRGPGAGRGPCRPLYPALAGPLPALKDPDPPAASPATVLAALEVREAPLVPRRHTLLAAIPALALALFAIVGWALNTQVNRLIEGVSVARTVWVAVGPVFTAIRLPLGIGAFLFLAVVLTALSRTLKPAYARVTAGS